jgi:predicted dehydrogenase
MNFCIIGLKWGKNYIKNLEFLEQNIAAICSRNSSDVDSQFLEYKHIKDYRKIALNEIDVACICTPPSSHFEMCKYFLTNKKHVIVEKPFVFLPDQADELKTLAVKHKVSLLISYLYLWNKDYLAVLGAFKGKVANRTIENNSIGNVSREEYSFLWDYSSHDLAMVYHIIGDKTPLKIKFLEETKEGYSYMLEGNNLVVKNTFRFDAGAKVRNMIISCDAKVSRFEDNYSDNSILTMLSEFIDAVSNGVTFTNIDVAISVTNTLAELSNYKEKS